MKKLKIGILGCGGVAYRWYLSGLSGSKPNYELAAVADIDLEKAKSAAKQFNVPYFYNTLEKIKTHEGMDLIVVLTRHKDHFEHIQSILNSGINVYSEKPFAETFAEGKKLVKLATKKNLYFGSAPQVMLSTRNQKIKELIDSGKIGKFVFGRVSCSNMGPADRKGIDFDPEWFYQDGGSMKSLGIYNLAAITYILGMPKFVSGFSGIAIPNREVMYGPYTGKKFAVNAPDNQVAMFDYGDGAYVLYDGSYSVMTPPKYEFELHGTKGSIFAGGFGGKESVVLKEREKEEVMIGPEDDCHIRWTLAWGVEETINAIMEKRVTRTNANFALDVIYLMESIEKSNLTKKHIQMKPQM